MRCRRRHRRRRVKGAKCRRRRRLEEPLGEREDARASEARRDRDRDRTLEAAKRREVARDRRGEEVARTADRTVGRTAEADRTVVAAVVEARLAEDGTPVAIRARVRPRGIEGAAGDTTAIAIETDDLFLNVEGFNIKVSQLNNDDKHLNIFLFYSSADLFKRARSIACLMNTFVSSVNGMSVRSDIVRRTSSI